jgi:hypothetical protein
MLDHFQRLCDELPEIREQVAAIESPNPEDDRPVRFAIVGYSYHRSIESWGREELEFVKRRRHEVADFDARWVEFTCLASGYLLGLYQAERCSDAEFTRFEAQLPGLMWLHSARFTDG